VLFSKKKIEERKVTKIDVLGVKRRTYNCGVVFETQKKRNDGKEKKVQKKVLGKPGGGLIEGLAGTEERLLRYLRANGKGGKVEKPGKDRKKKNCNLGKCQHLKGQSFSRDIAHPKKKCSTKREPGKGNA